MDTGKVLGGVPGFASMAWQPPNSSLSRSQAARNASKEGSYPVQRLEKVWLSSWNTV